MKKCLSVFLALLLFFGGLPWQSAVVAADSVSTAPYAGNIIVTNNLTGKLDNVFVNGLSSGDLVKIFDSATDGSILAYGIVAAQKTSITLNVAQLGTAAGSVYVSVVSKGLNESTRTQSSYSAEPKSDMLALQNVCVTNNAGKSDTIYVSGLTSGDIVKAYDSASGGKLLGSKKSSSTGDLTMTIAQIGSTSAYVYMSVTQSGKLEGDRLEVSCVDEPVSSAPDANNITVNNNAKKADTVYVSALVGKDVVKIYDSAVDGKLLGSKTIASSGYDATISISQIGAAAGSIYVSITSSGYAESSRTKVDFEAEYTSDDPDEDYITVTNNSGKSDTVCVSGLSGSDVVKVYSAGTKGSLLGTATVSSSGYEATITISQLGTSSGSVYVTVTSTGKNESARVEAGYSAEKKSSSVSDTDIVVTNNVGKSDTIYASGLEGGDIVKVYDSKTGGDLLGSKTVSSSGYSVTITISQLGTASGSIYVSITSSGERESSRTEVEYSAESESTAPDANYINVTNNAGSSDTIYITRLSAGDVITVYDAKTSGTVLGSGTVASSSSSITITITQLGTAAGSVYITAASTGKAESDRVCVSYSEEGETTALSENNISISNNAGTSDTIYVSGLSSKDVVRVYSAATSGSLLGSGTVGSSGNDVTITISQLGTASGSVYLTVTSADKSESSRIKASYKAESASDTIDSSDITVTNNSGTSDTVYVNGLSEGDIVKVYDSETGGTLLGSATVDDSETDVTITISQLGTSASSVYISVKGTNKSESSRIEASYDAEASTAAPSADNIVVTNNIQGTSDTICVTKLSPGDVVKVYDAASKGNVLGTATVQSGSTSVTVTVTQLGTAAGSIYVTNATSGKKESGRTQVEYSTESESTPPSNIVVTNNSGSDDTVYASNLSAGDAVKVYDAAKGGNQLGTATVSTYGSSATVTISQLGSMAGSVYVTVTSTSKSESSRTQADYTAEPVSAAVSGSRITVTNNAGTSDTVKVTGLSASDVVKVYDSSSGGTQLGSATVASSSTSATVTISQIGTSAGSIYVSITSTNKSESSRTEATYSAEAQSGAISADNVTITNSSGIASTVEVTGLKDGDVINVYDSETGGKLLGTGTVATYGSDVTISVSTLGTSGGDVYVAVTSTGKYESERTKVTYGSKTASTAPNASNITIENNSGIADTITVTGLDSGSAVKVYSASTGGTALGTATTASGSLQATVTITQLGTGSGSVYVTVTSSGKTESSRVEAQYSEEGATDAIAAGNVTIKNYSGMSDTITITGLSSGDIVKVYNASSSGTKLATATATSDSVSMAMAISQLGTSAGSVYITVTTSGKTESIRTEIQYVAESTAITASNVTVTNNAGGVSDTIIVSNLAENDVIRAYDAASDGNLLGYATVSTGSTSATITVSQLTTAAGYVYVAVANYGREESSLTRVAYLAEQSTSAPYIGDIYVVNNVDIDDTVTVYNLTSGDVVKVYDASSSGNLLGYATVASNSTEVTVSVDDLGSSAGAVYISLTTKGKTESSRTEASYVAETQSTVPYSGNIYVTNNVSIADTVLVSELTTGDKVKVYSDSDGSDLLGYATCSSSSTQLTVSISQLGISAGSVYVSITSKGKFESERTEAEYVSEQTTNEPYIGNITVVNNTGASDTVTVAGLTGSDIIRVYDSASDGNLLGNVTVTSGSTAGTVTISQLGTSSGSIYVSITSTGKSESNRTKVDFISE